MKEYKGIVGINKRRLGRNIGRALDRKNIFHKDFAYGIGINQEYLSQICNGRRTPSFYLLAVIAAEAETDFNTLLEGVITRPCE